MAELMKKIQSNFVNLKKGSVVSGIITKLTPSEILVDIGGKTEAQVLEKDRNILKNILSTLKIGDKVEVSILNPESDFGNSVVSLRRFMDEKLWGNLSDLVKSKKQFDINVNDTTRGGFLVSSDTGISGFLPNSQAIEVLSPGQKTKAFLLEFDKPTHKVVFSQKKKVDTNKFAKAVKSIKTEQEISATVTSIAPFGIFANVKTQEGDLEGFVHISEISWDPSANASGQALSDFKVGNVVKAVVLGFDKKSSRINLSIKRLSKDPNIEKLKAFSADKKVEGEVTKIISSGVLLELPDNVTGFIKKDKIPVGTNYSEGQKVTATVAGIDERNHRVNLVPYLTKKTIGYR